MRSLNTKARNLLIILTCLISGFYACKKDSSNSYRIVGKWTLVRDTSYTGVGISNHMVAYEGQSGDYFDFRTDGNVYTKEGVTFDTLTYSIKSSNEIVISKFGIVANGTPTVSEISVTAHSATIITPGVITPGGQFGRDVILTR